MTQLNNKQMVVNWSHGPRQNLLISMTLACISYLTVKFSDQAIAQQNSETLCL